MTYIEAYNCDERVRIQKVLDKDRVRQYHLKRILEVEDSKLGDYDRPTWSLPKIMGGLK